MSGLEGYSTPTGAIVYWGDPANEQGEALDRERRAHIEAIDEAVACLPEEVGQGGPEKLVFWDTSDTDRRYPVVDAAGFVDLLDRLGTGKGPQGRVIVSERSGELSLTVLDPATGVASAGFIARKVPYPVWKRVAENRALLEHPQAAGGGLSVEQLQGLRAQMLYRLWGQTEPIDLARRARAEVVPLAQAAERAKHAESRAEDKGPGAEMGKEPVMEENSQTQVAASGADGQERAFLSFPKKLMHVYDRTTKDGTRNYKLAVCSIPKGIVVDGRDLGGFAVDMFVGEAQEKALADDGRNRVTWAPAPDKVLELWQGKGEERQAVQVVAADLAAAFQAERQAYLASHAKAQGIEAQSRQAGGAARKAGAGLFPIAVPAKCVGEPRERTSRAGKPYTMSRCTFPAGTRLGQMDLSFYSVGLFVNESQRKQLADGKDSITFYVKPDASLRAWKGAGESRSEVEIAPQEAAAAFSGMEAPAVGEDEGRNDPTEERIAAASEQPLTADEMVQEYGANVIEVEDHDIDF